MMVLKRRKVIRKKNLKKTSILMEIKMEIKKNLRTIQKLKRKKMMVKVWFLQESLSLLVLKLNTLVKDHLRRIIPSTSKR
jgi:hypothetical protein